MASYEFKGSQLPDSWVTHIILERDDDDVVTKEAYVGGAPVELTKTEVDDFAKRGLVFEEVSKKEAEKRAEERAASGLAAGDTAGAAPIIGAPTGKPNQAADGGDER